jgi:hypothetical protein
MENIFKLGIYQCGDKFLYVLTRKSDHYQWVTNIDDIEVLNLPPHTEIQVGQASADLLPLTKNFREKLLRQGAVSIQKKALEFAFTPRKRDDWKVFVNNTKNMVRPKSLVAEATHGDSKLAYLTKVRGGQL